MLNVAMQMCCEAEYYKHKKQTAEIKVDNNRGQMNAVPTIEQKDIYRAKNPFDNYANEKPFDYRQQASNNGGAQQNPVAAQAKMDHNHNTGQPNSDYSDPKTNLGGQVNHETGQPNSDWRGQENDPYKQFGTYKDYRQHTQDQGWRKQDNGYWQQNQDQGYQQQDQNGYWHQQDHTGYQQHNQNGHQWKPFEEYDQSYRPPNQNNQYQQQNQENGYRFAGNYNRYGSTVIFQNTSVICWS
jgi:hypothetical protein